MGSSYVSGWQVTKNPCVTWHSHQLTLRPGPLLATHLPSKTPKQSDQAPCIASHLPSPPQLTLRRMASMCCNKSLPNSHYDEWTPCIALHLPSPLLTHTTTNGLHVLQHISPTPTLPFSHYD